MGEREEKEGQGFVVRDRRKVSLDESGDVRSQTPETEKSKAFGEQEKSAEDAGRDKERIDSEKASGRSQEHAETLLPEVSFSTFVFSLSSSALVYLGEVPDPSTQQSQMNLNMAKHIIDTLGMLEEKTRGNLDKDEEQLVKSILYDLRMRFVQKSKK